MNLYKNKHKKYIEYGYSIIPCKFKSKLPAIKNWSEYCYRLPTREETSHWSENIEESNIDICLGEASSIIALDLDTTDQRILDLILPILPYSPVEKKGAKGFTRFFKYNGEHSQSLKYNGEMILEVLSSNKKTTIPPSIHPSGVPYTWTGEKELLDIDKNELPLLPPYLISNIESKLKLHIPDITSNGSKGIVSGRNDGLAKLCGKLIQDKVPVDNAIKQLIEYDEKEHETPLFTDINEMPHSEKFTNALQFYTNILQTANTRHFRDNKAYEIPVTASAVNAELAKELDGKKLQAQVSEKESNQELICAKSVENLPVAKGILKNLYDNIMENSFIPQPEFAFSASLVALGTLISRKFTFQGMSSNLYILNIAPSGSGKDACQQKLKEYFSDIGAENLLGAGDYVSDASLMDGLEAHPVRLDILDEAGGILKTVNRGKQDFNGKMADILAELYTSSNSRYLGRAIAGGDKKGACDRPNVSILASTTPTGFQEGISLKAIEKGLMGRFLVFLGDSNKKARRVKNFTKLDKATKSKLSYFAAYRPQESEMTVGFIPQLVTEIDATKAANNRLDEIFEEFDNLRRNTKHDNALLPIIARLYQQMVKIVMIHAASRTNMNEPKVDLDDVEFAYKTILYYYNTISKVVDKYIHGSYQEEITSKLYNIIRDNNGLTKTELVRKTRFLDKYKRQNILIDLVEAGEIVITTDENAQEVYKCLIQ